MTRLLIIRHATNDVREKGILAGRTPGVHLNQEGQAQAEALASRLVPAEIEAIYSSPLERCLETAKIIDGPHGLPVTVREGLGEIHFGRWTGQPFEKLRRRRLWRNVQFVPSTMRFPGGESLREMQMRVVAELESVRAKHPQRTVAIVSHADVIKAAVAYYVGLHLDLFQRLVIAPASLTILDVGKGVPRLQCLNDTAHLQSIERRKGEEREE